MHNFLCSYFHCLTNSNFFVRKLHSLEEMKGLLASAFLLTSLAVSVVIGQSDYTCYADIAEPNLYFATKTSYKFIKNTNIDEITLPGMIFAVLKLCISNVIFADFLWFIIRMHPGSDVAVFPSWNSLPSQRPRTWRRRAKCP